MDRKPDENACIPPTLANAKYTENSNGWYVNGDIIRTTCDKGYEHKDRVATARCINGIWSSLPICEKSSDTCSEPPKIPHAVIIHQDYQEVFAADSELHYECEDGYTVEGEQAKKSIFCIAGNWTEGPKCSIGTGPDTGHGGSTEVGTGGKHTTSAGQGTQQGAGGRPDSEHGGSTEVGTGGKYTTSAGRGTQRGAGDTFLICRPDGEHGGSTEVGTGGKHTTSADHGTQVGAGGRPDGEHGGSTEVGAGGRHTTSADHGTQVGGGGSSTTSGSRREHVTIEYCGKHPHVPNGDVVQVTTMHLKYKCNAFYQQVGSNIVVCFDDGTWSHVPICKDAFCIMAPGKYHHGLELSVSEFIKEGEKKHLPCTWFYYSVVVWCTNGRIISTQCCRNDDHNRMKKLQQSFQQSPMQMAQTTQMAESSDTCSEPPKIPHAVIIHQGYHEMFDADSEVHYECEDGYTVEGAHTNKSGFRIAGT
ncbi:complement factor H-like [Xiphias gladius]|uniref:complement factor H-like n=1 Tax=Xiphias gladius TaxID=8245 RepID=UPI001A97D7F8|nr:complement factor H-like [Xiphias gladius]